MRIAIFHDLPSGGAKRALYEQVKRLALKHTIDVYSLSTADHAFCDLQPLVDQYVTYDFPPRRLFKSPLGRVNQFQRWLDIKNLDNLAIKMARQIDRQSYDVVYAHPCIWTQAPLVIRYLQTPVVYYLQEPPRHLYVEDWIVPTKGFRMWLDKVDPLLYLYRTLAKRLDLNATQSSQLVLVNSQFMQARVKEIYSIDSRVCYLGVDTSVFRPLQNIRRQDFVLSVGAIHPPKGFDFIIRSLGCIEESHRPALHLVGNMINSYEGQRLYTLADALGVKLQVEINLDQLQLVERYNQACLFIYAPYHEPFGLAPLEAMACGLPVVGVSEGGVKETVHDGVSGRLVARDLQQMAQAILWFMNNPEERYVFGQRGIENVIKKWSWGESVKQIDAQLQAAVL